MYLGALATRPRTQGGKLSTGARGTHETLSIMRTLARDGAKDPIIREASVRAIRAAGVRDHDFDSEAVALFTFVRDRVRFVRDTHGVEVLQRPTYTLAHGFGDCDDKATLLGAMLLSIGQDVRFRAVGMTRAGFGHVYVVTRINGRDVPLDPTWGGTPAGWELRNPALSGDFPL